MSELRPALPKVPGAATTNAAGSYHRAGEGFVAYPLLAPVKLGRSLFGVLVPELTKPTLIVCGTPLWIVVFALNCQPPTNAFSTELLMSKSLPLPTGRS